MTFKVLTIVTIKIMICWYVTPPSFVIKYHLFRGTYTLNYMMSDTAERNLSYSVRVSKDLQRFIIAALKRVDLREIGWDGMDWMDLAQDSDQWRALVNTVINIRVLLMLGNS
jgi:hypothetical protein